MTIHRKILTVFCVATGIFACNLQAQTCVRSQSDVVTLYFGVETPLPDPCHPHTIPVAHTDIEMPFRFAGGWDIHIKTDSPAANTRVETEDALFALGTAYRFSFPGSIPPGFEFIGIMPNQTFWYYDGEAPSPGYDSQDMTNAEIASLCQWNPNNPAKGAASMNKWLQVRLVAVRGPQNGFASMWEENETAPIVFFASADGISEADVYYTPARRHSHKSWAFTKPGLYELDLQVSTYYVCDPLLTADLNDDCFVDMQDFALFAAQWVSDGLLDFVEQWLDCGSPFDSECP